MRLVRCAALGLLSGLAGHALGAQAATACVAADYPPPAWDFESVARMICWLTTRPIPIDTTRPATLGRYSGTLSMHVMVVVTSYGSVDRDRTRIATANLSGAGARGPELGDSMMFALSRYRFVPALAGDTPVRSAHWVDIVARSAPDTIPAVSNWRFVVGVHGTDTLRLEWTPTTPLPAAAPSELGRAIAAALAELRTTHTFANYRDRDAAPWTGCIAIAKTITGGSAVEAWLRTAGVQLSGEGACGRFSAGNAVQWTRAFRTAPAVYTLIFTAPVHSGGRCHVALVDGAWTGSCD